MKHQVLWLGAALGLSALMSSADAAKPPAYTFARLGFSTSLKGVPEGERRSECLDRGCTERRGVLVAEGKTTTLATPVTIRILEHRYKGAGKGELQALASKLQGVAPRGKVVKTSLGEVADRPALSQWAIWDGCNRSVVARVLVAMPDKILEVETRSILEPGHEQEDNSVKAMSQVLRKLRVRRLGDVELDPASEDISVKELARAMPRGCEP
ncbi:MAG: hypothetical protein RMJ98_03345 [Myxococcales bacterium]|nr:hypothetical protein [Polyangiaceae bacterium]MDW8248326.1 hypothetical protein [Myxococcales bacterium]